MTAAAIAPAPERPLTPGLHVSLPAAIASEWIKFRSLRSTIWTLLVSVVLTVGIAAAAGAAIGSQDRGDVRDDFHPVSSPLGGVNFALVAVGVLGVLSFSGEYKTGMIRSSMTAVPRRVPVLIAKAAIVIALVLPLMLISTFVAFFLSQALLSQNGLNVSLSYPGAVRTVVGAALYATVGALIGLGVGLVVRHSAGAIVTFISIFFVLPIVTAVIPVQWVHNIDAYLPDGSGSALWMPASSSITDTLAPWAGFGVMCAWAVAVLAAGAFRLVKSDV